MSTEEKSIYDAVDEAINEVTPPEDENEKTTDEERAQGADESSSGTGDDAGAGASGQDDARSGSAGDEKDASGRESSDEETAADDAEDGTAADGESGEEGAGDAGAEGDDSEGAADEDDPINDPIPASLSERTQNRIKSLINTAKENTQAASERDELLTAITATGADPQQYAGALTVLRLYNSDKIEDKKQALGIVQGMARELALEIGEGQQYVKLTDYPDLQAEVEEGTLTETRALEIATNRAAMSARTAKNDAKNEADESARNTARLVNQGKADLNALGEELQTDPAYKALYPTFTSILGPVLRAAHPTQWKELARETFVKLKAANPAIATSPPPPPPANGGAGGKPAHTPLRPKQGAGGGGGKESGVTSALDAVNAALEGM